MWLVFESGGDEGRSVRASGERFVIGRDAGSALVVNDEKASRNHAYLRVYDDGRAELHDMGSANGTFVNGHRLTGPVLLQGGEHVQVGETVLRTSLTEPSAQATQIGVVPVDLDAPARGSDSSIERRKLRRSARTATAVGAVAIVAVAALGTLFATGVIGGDDDDPPPPPPTASADVPSVVRKARPSTVVILASTGQSGGRGTGWVLDAGQGLIVTNQHVVNDGETFEIGVGDQTRPATVVGAAPCDDLAVLRVADRSGLVSMPLVASQAEVEEGETVVALGFPASASRTPRLTTTVGVVSVAKTSFDQQALDVPMYPNVIQTSADINPGNSGGPLVDTDARLVGVNSAGITLLGGRTIQGQGYAIGIDRVREVVPSLAAGRSLFWTGLGLDFVPDPSDQPNLPQRPGLFVDNIVPGSPAAQVNFPKPSYIVAINGQSLDGTLQSYCNAVQSGPGDAATFSILTSSTGTPVDIRVPFATQPPA
ncbi:MAG TPA: trypsin-like peptidase domain-containing protein [Miltoncostaeaceae bacterium]|nr:trypsin-like peptidase domain-containing protein [Miltoncostaeaceae bacterium]